MDCYVHLRNDEKYTKGKRRDCSVSDETVHDRLLAGWVPNICLGPRSGYTLLRTNS
jgi:hypothetical protein